MATTKGKFVHSKNIFYKRTSQKLENILFCENLSRHFSSRCIWSGISIHLADGERLALTGSSGSGKSLLLRTLAGLDTPNAGPSGENGSINFGGKSITDWEMPKYRAKVCYISQQPEFFDETVEANLKRVFLLREHRSRKYKRKKIINWLEHFFPHLNGAKTSGSDDFIDFLERPAKRLSAGEKQIIALLRVLQIDPKILLLDEPTASLDTELTKLFEKLLENWHTENSKDSLSLPNSKFKRTWIWTSHNQEQLKRMCNKTYSLDENNGK